MQPVQPKLSFKLLLRWQAEQYIMHALGALFVFVGSNMGDDVESIEEGFMM